MKHEKTKIEEVDGILENFIQLVTSKTEHEYFDISNHISETIPALYALDFVIKKTNPMLTKYKLDKKNLEYGIKFSDDFVLELTVDLDKKRFEIVLESDDETYFHINSSDYHKKVRLDDKMDVFYNLPNVSYIILTNIIKKLEL